MKADLGQFRHLKSSAFWLLGIAAGLAAIHLTLTWRMDNADLFGSSLLFFAVIGTSIKDRRGQLRLESGITSSLLSVLLIGLLLTRSMFRPSDTFLLLLPLLAGLAVALLASGFQGLAQYRREFILLAFLGGPKVFLPLVFDPTPLTAQFSTLVLWYLGFEVYRDGFMIHLPTGSVEVYSGCSGIDSITHLLSLSGLFLILVPVGLGLRILVPLVGMLIAFVVNGFRVALMAYLVAARQPEAFDYWHEGNGSLIFSMIAVFIFGVFCYLIMKWTEARSDDSSEEDWDNESEDTLTSEIGLEEP